MKKLGLGPMRALAHIRPPDPSFEDWHRFLDQCQHAGLSAVFVDREGDFINFATPVGLSLLRRWRWLRDCEARGIGYEQAEYEFEAAMERDGEALRRAEADRLEALDRMTREREQARAVEERVAKAADRLRSVVDDEERKMQNAVERLRPGWRDEQQHPDGD